MEGFIHVTSLGAEFQSYNDCCTLDLKGLCAGMQCLEQGFVTLISLTMLTAAGVEEKQAAIKEKKCFNSCLSPDTDIFFVLNVVGNIISTHIYKNLHAILNVQNFLPIESTKLHRWKINLTPRLPGAIPCERVSIMGIGEIRLLKDMCCSFLASRSRSFNNIPV